MIYFFLFLQLPFIFFACSNKPESEKERSSYMIGLDIGGGLRKQGIAIEEKELIHGIRDALNDREPVMSQEELGQTRNAFNRKMQENATLERKQNLASGKDFLEQNKKNPGWKVLPSGLQYKVLKEGKGKSPKANSTVKVHYIGTLLDGTKFDSSRDKGSPLELRVNSVIRGWAEALPLMKEGSHWVLLLPPELAYGERGAGPIPPNAVLMFDIELVQVK